MSELYLFSEGNIYYYLTPELLPETYLGNTYRPAVMERSEVRKTTNLVKGALTIKIDLKDAFAVYLLSRSADSLLKLTIFKNGNLYWKGLVTSVTSDGTTINAVCEYITSSLKRIGIKNTMSLSCRHRLYSSPCSIVQEANRYDFANRTVTGKTHTIAGLTQPTGFFSNGIAVIGAQTRGIITQISTVLTFSSPFIGIVSGTLSIYPGCALTEDNCKNKFTVNNLLNFGGFSRIPPKNPFGQNGLF